MLTVDLDRAGVRAGTRLLDIGCGGGRHAYACLKKRAEVVALDLDEAEVHSVRSMFRAMRQAGEVDETRSVVGVADAFSLPFADATFDVVIASEVLEHLRDDGAAIAELARVLRRGGVLALSVPRLFPETINWALSRAYHDTPGGHVRIYRRRQLTSRLQAAALVPFHSHHRHGLHSPYWWLRCAVGVTKENHPLVRVYHRFLVWDIVHRPRTTRVLDAMLNPIIGKSLVLYCEHR